MEDKPAYRIGTMIHEMILEPEEFKKNYSFCMEKIDRRTKEGKQILKLKEHEGTELVSLRSQKIYLESSKRFIQMMSSQISFEVFKRRGGGISLFEIQGS